jgi:ribonuclease-3
MSAPPESLQAQLDYQFVKPELLRLALTHPSWLQENPEVMENNQRLEFLGDAVLQLILTEALFELFPGEREGELSKRRSALANGHYLAKLAVEIDLAPHLLLAKNEVDQGGRNRPAALEDAFEATIGAIYLDSDFATTRRVVRHLYGNLTLRLAEIIPTENPKGRLQERIQSLHGNGALRYETAHIAGEDHAREYKAHVYLLDMHVGSGRGSSKKAAEEAAAANALESDRLPKESE